MNFLLTLILMLILAATQATDPPANMAQWKESLDNLVKQYSWLYTVTKQDSDFALLSDNQTLRIDLNDYTFLNVRMKTADHLGDSAAPLFEVEMHSNTRHNSLYYRQDYFFDKDHNISIELFLDDIKVQLDELANSLSVNQALKDSFRKIIADELLTLELLEKPEYSDTGSDQADKQVYNYVNDDNMKIVMLIFHEDDNNYLKANIWTISEEYNIELTSHNTNEELKGYVSSIMEDIRQNYKIELSSISSVKTIISNAVAGHVKCRAIEEVLKSSEEAPNTNKGDILRITKFKVTAGNTFESVFKNKQLAEEEPGKKADRKLDASLSRYEKLAKKLRLNKTKVDMSPSSADYNSALLNDAKSYSMKPYLSSGVRSLAEDCVFYGLEIKAEIFNFGPASLVHVSFYQPKKIHTEIVFKLSDDSETKVLIEAEIASISDHMAANKTAFAKLKAMKNEAGYKKKSNDIVIKEYLKRENLQEVNMPSAVQKIKEEFKDEIIEGSSTESEQSSNIELKDKSLIALNVNDRNDTLVLSYRSNNSDENVKNEEVRIPIGKTLVGWPQLIDFIQKIKNDIKSKEHQLMV